MEVIKKHLEKVEILSSRLKNYLSSQNTGTENQIPAQEYHACYNALSNQLQSNHSRMIEEAVIKEFESQIEKYIKEVFLPALSFKNGQELLTEFGKQWSNFKLFVHFLRKAFSWLDLYALVNHKNPKDPTVPVTLANKAYTKLLEGIENFLKTKFFDVLYEFLERERSHEQVPRLEVQKAIKVYNSLCYKNFDIQYDKDKKEIDISLSKRVKSGIYENIFAKGLLEKLNAYYKAYSLKSLNHSVPEYLISVENSLKFEEDQCSFYYERSRDEVLGVIEKELITEHMGTLIRNETSGLFPMLLKGDQGDIKLFYKLSKRGKGNNDKELSLAFANFIETAGKKINDEIKDAIEYTKKFLELKATMDEIVEKCFNNDIQFQTQRDNGFRAALLHNDKSYGYFATYVDFQFIKDLKGKDEQKVEEVLNSFIKIFAYLSSKDGFLKIYGKLLAKRLINGQSLDFNAEKDMIKKLSAECGRGPVSKLDNMLNDITLSREYQEKFAQKKPKNPLIPLVLTSAHWPLSEVENSKLPDFLLKYTSEFDTFYKSYDSAFSLRIVKWILSEGKAEVMLNLNVKVQLDVKSQQLPILYLFEKQNSQTVKQIQELTGINESVLEEYLKFMCGHPANLFLRTGQKFHQDSTFDKNEKISINLDFKTNNKKILFFPAKLQKLNNPKEDAGPDLENERGFVIDSLAVRVMKHRKAYKYNSLIEETIRMCTIFTPQINLIKKRIEVLIEKGYFKRDENDRATLIYIP